MRTAHLRHALFACSVIAVMAAGATSLSAGAAGDVRILDATRQQNKGAIPALIKQGADVNATAADGMTSLIWSAHWDDLATVQQLIRAGANVNAANRYGVTALAEAAGIGNASMIKTLLQAGANPNAALIGGGETPLMRAAKTGNVEAVELLLAKGANPNAAESERGQTALMYAVIQNHAAAAKALIARGADVNAQSTYWDNEDKAVRGGSIAYNYENGGLSALLFAARDNAIEAGEVLIEAGANMRFEEQHFKVTPMLMAIHNGNYAFASMLVRKGADLDGTVYLVADVRNEPPITKRPNPPLKGSLELMATLIEWGADPNQPLRKVMPRREQGNPRNPTIASPLYRAARNMDLDAMRVLLDHGADPNAGTGAKEAPMMAVFQALGKYTGAQAEVIGEPDPERIVASLKLLVQYGADVNAVNNAGNTALHIAAQRGRDPAVQFLAESHANLTIKNKQDLTPLDMANGLGGGVRRAGGDDEETPAPAQGTTRAVPPRETTVALLKKLMN